MDWKFLATIIIAVAFFIATLVLSLKVTKKKEPVWAYTTRKIIGLGTDAPPEVKLTFDERPVNDVYQTIFVLFNKGNEAIRKNDISENVAIHFKEADILRQPIILARSKEAIKASVEQVVKNGDDAIELSFLYLDHADGAVVMVLHTESRDISCSGSIIGTTGIGYAGEFHPARTSLFFTELSAFVMLVAIPVGILTAFLSGDWSFPLETPELVITILFVIVWISLLPFAVIAFGRRKFPKWTGVKE